VVGFRVPRGRGHSVRRYQRRRLAAFSCGRIQGVVKSDDTQAKVSLGVMIGIRSHEGAAQGSNVDAAGHFTFGRVLPGGYEFKLLKNPEGVVLRSVTCRGAVVTARR
jgi:hypothetical protein